MTLASSIKRRLPNSLAHWPLTLPGMRKTTNWVKLVERIRGLKRKVWESREESRESRVLSPEVYVGSSPKGSSNWIEEIEASVALGFVAILF
ncbi:hypothetical protein M0804_009328 [Polistes exclamans]|nr:hypothetical protein M0804_009328 [Polistes exclamans]